MNGTPSATLKTLNPNKARKILGKTPAGFNRLGSDAAVGYDRESKEQENKTRFGVKHKLGTFFEEDEETCPMMMDIHAENMSKKLTKEIIEQDKRLKADLIRAKESGGTEPVQTEPQGTYPGPKRSNSGGKGGHTPGRQTFPSLPDDEDDVPLQNEDSALPPLSAGLDDEPASQPSTVSAGLGKSNYSKSHKYGQAYPEFDDETAETDPGSAPAPTQKPSVKPASASELIQAMSGGRIVNASGYEPGRTEFPDF